MTTKTWLFVCPLFAACAAPTTAVINGQVVPRVDLGFSNGAEYSLVHRRAFPEQRGPSSGLRSYAGELNGRICGVDVLYDAEYHGRYLSVVGFISPALADGRRRGAQAVHFEARDRLTASGGERRIIGAVNQALENVLYAPRAADFSFGLERLQGRIGQRTYDLRRDGDDRLSGTVAMYGVTFPFQLDGIDELWSMPVADQVALLPLMMSCSYNVGAPVLSVNFRRPADHHVGSSSAM